MKLVLLLNILLCLKCCLSFSEQNDLQMIVDLITSYEQPTAVVANVCWKSVYKSKLATMLAKDRLINIQYIRKNERIGFNTIFSNHLLFLVDLKCEPSKSFLNQATPDMFSKTYRWLILSNTNDTMEEFVNCTILVDSEFVVAEERGNGNFLLQSVYKIQPKSAWIKQHYATWTTNNGLNISKVRNISNVMRRKDLQESPITVSIIITDNRTKTDYMEISKNIFVDPATKSAYATITNLYDFINATRVIIFSETWGYFVNGSWTGMIGDINAGRADLCGCMTFMTKDRLKILQYIRDPASIATPKIVFRQPPLSYQFNLFILPFTTNVWYSLGGLVILFIIILYLNAKWDVKKYEDYKEETLDKTCLRAVWSDITIFVLSAISQQGSYNELKGTLGRLVMFIVFLVFLFFYTSYSASIVVLLQSTSNHIRTVTDLMNSKLELGIEDIVYNRYYFSPTYARDPVRKAFYETKIAPKGSKPNFLSLEDGVKKLQTEPFAFNMNVASGYRIISQYFQEHEKCGLLEIDYIQASKALFCSKKSSPYNEMFRVGFCRIEEHGLSDRNNRRIFAKKPTCTTLSGNFGSVKMVDFYPVLLILFYGMVLAFALLILELLVHRRTRTNETF